MLAVDNSTLISLAQGEEGPDIELFTTQLLSNNICLPPTVITEVISNPTKQTRIHQLMWQLPMLEPTFGFWHRAGELRSKVLAAKRKCRTADTLIAQSCIDHDVALITRDADFKVFTQVGALKIAA
jgi:predicted nucleic acid-binding protein